MTSFAFRTFCAFCIAGASAVAVHAQPTTTTDLLLARADSITVGDYCDVSRAALLPDSIRRVLADDSTLAAQQSDIICNASLPSLSLRALQGNQHVSLAAVARVHAGRGVPSPLLVDAMETFRRLVRSPAVRPVAASQLTDSVNRQLVRVVETAHSLLVMSSRDAALERLQRYERKLGPSSARLNGMEVFANYMAQRFVPGFRPSAAKGPSPIELVVAYVPTYATITARKLAPVSATEFGFRWYLFGDRFGQSGVRGLVYPSHFSLGALVTGTQNGALEWPWAEATRTGAFLGWGAIKVGYVGGRNGSFLVTRQTQIVPFAF